MLRICRKSPVVTTTYKINYRHVTSKESQASRTGGLTPCNQIQKKRQRHGGHLPHRSHIAVAGVQWQVWANLTILLCVVRTNQHVFLHFIWYTCWHFFWHSICYLAFCLTYVLTCSHIGFAIRSDNVSCILAGIYIYILYIFILHFIGIGILSKISSGSLSRILSGVPHFFDMSSRILSGI